MRISDWSSDVCSSDLTRIQSPRAPVLAWPVSTNTISTGDPDAEAVARLPCRGTRGCRRPGRCARHCRRAGRRKRTQGGRHAGHGRRPRSEEHTSELPSLMRLSYDVFCLTNKHNTKKLHKSNKL